MQIKLIEALARRKELANKVAQLNQISPHVLSETKSSVKSIGKQGTDEIVAEIEVQVPRISTTQLTHASDWHNKQLRKVDIAIQQANHITLIDIEDNVMADYVDPYVVDSALDKKGQ